MAWLETDRHGRLRIGFKYGGRKCRESLGVVANKQTVAARGDCARLFSWSCEPERSTTAGGSRIATASISWVLRRRSSSSQLASRNSQGVGCSASKARLSDRRTAITRKLPRFSFSGTSSASDGFTTCVGKTSIAGARGWTKSGPRLDGH